MAERRSTRSPARGRPALGLRCTAQLATLGDRRPARHRPPRDDQIWLGETAPLGDDRPAAAPSARCARPRSCAKKIRKTSPETFLRGVFCLNTKGEQLTGAEASDQHCGGYKKLSVTGYAHHPYTRGGSRPPLSRRQRRRDHDQRRLAPDEAARPGGAGASGSRPSCRSTTPSTAGRPTRPDHDLRRHRRPAGRVHQPVRLDRLQQSARARPSRSTRSSTTRTSPPASRWACGCSRRRAQARLRRLQAADLGRPARARNVTVYGQVRPGRRPAPRGQVDDPERAARRRWRSRRSQTVPGDLGQRHLHRRACRTRAASGACAGTALTSRQAEVAPK